MSVRSPVWMIRLSQYAYAIQHRDGGITFHRSDHHLHLTPIEVRRLRQGLQEEEEGKHAPQDT